MEESSTFNMVEWELIRKEEYSDREDGIINSWAVGFLVNCNGRKEYYDTLVFFDEATTEKEIIEKAKEKIKMEFQKLNET